MGGSCRFDFRVSGRCRDTHRGCDHLSIQMINCALSTVGFGEFLFTLSWQNGLKT